MNIEFEVEEVLNGGLKEYHVYDVTNEEKIYAGCVKNFTWNKGMRVEINALEPFNADGGRMSHGLSASQERDLDKMIGYVKSSHEDHVKRKKMISDRWESRKEDAKRLGVSEEDYKRYSNPRSYIDSVLEYEKFLSETENELSVLRAFANNDAYASVPDLVHELVEKSIKQHVKDIERSKKEIEIYKGYLKKQ